MRKPAVIIVTSLTVLTGLMVQARAVSVIGVGTGVGRPGGMACVAATLSGGGAPIASTSNDLGFSADQFGVTDCTINPAIGAGTTANKQVGSASPTPGVHSVAVFGGQQIIPDGHLYSCTFAIDTDTPADSYPLTNTAEAFDPNGEPIADVSGTQGQLIVTSCTGDCNGNGTVSISEVIRCVNLFLGQPLCNAANPAVNCPVADVNHNSQLSIGEVTLCVSRFLTGCSGAGLSVCGNGVVESGEDCDDGGTCIGGPNAGTHCTADFQCTGSGVCIGGPKVETACANDSACPGGKCVHCVPQGGDACASNCTFESDVVFPLVPGVAMENTLQAGTSGLVDHIPGFPIPFPLSGTQTLTLGKERNGTLPAVIKTASVQFAPTNVFEGLLCACIRGITRKTCGGTVFLADGTPAPDCTPDYTAGDSVCAGLPACTYVHGAGNAAHGVIGCSSAIAGTDVSVVQDSLGSADDPRCNGGDPDFTGPCGAPPVVTFSSSGSGGAALFFDTIAVGSTGGACPPGFCTDADPQNTRGTPFTVPLVTATATGEVDDINGQDGVNVGPIAISGAAFDCTALAMGSSSGGALAGASTELNLPLAGDIVITTFLKAQ